MPIVAMSDIKNVNEYFQKVMLKRVVYRSGFEQFAIKGQMDGNQYASWLRVNRVDPGVGAPLTDGVNPTETAVTIDKLTAQAYYYGAFAKISRQAAKIDPVKATTEVTLAMGESGKELRENIIMYSLLSGSTNLRYSSAAANRAAVVAAITTADFDNIRLALEIAGAGYLKEIISGDAKIGTTPIPASYICFVDPYLAKDIRALTGFIKSSQYPDPKSALENEIGTIDVFRVISSNQMQQSILTGAGSATITGKRNNGSNCNVHRAIILSDQAFGTTDLESFQNIYKTAKEIGGALEAFSTTGYIMAMASKVVNGNWVGVIETAVNA